MSETERKAEIEHVCPFCKSDPEALADAHGEGWRAGREVGRREAQADVVAALKAAGEDIKGRIRRFNRLDAHREYLNALHDAWGLVANRRRDAERLVTTPESTSGGAS